MSQHFGTRKLLRYTMPPVAMMVFTSIYTVVDGFFVSNFVGSTALAAINFVYPIPMILGTVGFMLGTGGTAIVAKTRGEGDDERANRYFSLMVYAAAVLSVVFMVVGIATLRPLLVAMGAGGAMLQDAMTYGLVLLAFLPGIVLQYAFQSFAMAAGTPKLGLVATIVAGVSNIVLDALFIYVLGWGVAGAAVASGIGELLGAAIPLVYFSRKNPSPLKLGRTKLEWRVLGKACANGASEMVSNIAMSVVTIVYNIQLLGMIGEAGVAAYGVIMYVSLMFVGVFLGYSAGCSPLVSFQYGAQNRTEMRSLLLRSIAINAVFGLLMLLASRLLALPLANLFVGYDTAICDLTAHGLWLYALAFTLMGFNIYGSSFFTALNNGLVSAIISFVRSFVFEIGSVMLLPLILGVDGIWLSVLVAEIASLIMTAAFVVGLEPRYGYLKKPERENPYPHYNRCERSTRICPTTGGNDD